MTKDKTGYTKASDFWASNCCYSLVMSKGPFVWRRLLICFGIAFVVAFAACWYDGALWLPGPDLGLLEDLPGLMLLVSLLWLVVGTNNLFNKLVNLLKTLGEVVPPSASTSAWKPRPVETEIREHLIGVFEKITVRRHRGYYSLTILFCVVLFLVMQVAFPLAFPQPIRAWALDPYRYPASFVVAVVWSAFWMVVIVGNALWYVGSASFMVFRAIRDLIETEKIKIFPASPDRSGGLASVGALSFAVTLVFGSGIPFLVGWMLGYGNDRPGSIGSVIYFLILLVMFFWPPMAVHLAMNDAKRDELSKLARRFKLLYDRQPFEAFEAAQESDGLRRAGELSEQLSRMDKLYERVQAMPVWPFDTRTLRQFFSLIMLPILIALLQNISWEFLHASLFGTGR